MLLLWHLGNNNGQRSTYLWPQCLVTAENRLPSAHLSAPLRKKREDRKGTGKTKTESQDPLKFATLSMTQMYHSRPLDDHTRQKRTEGRRLPYLNLTLCTHNFFASLFIARWLHWVISCTRAKILSILFSSVSTPGA